MSKTIDELNAEIEEYIHHASSGFEQGDLYVNQWVLVFNAGRMSESVANLYEVEAFPPTSPPHSIIGLIDQGRERFEEVLYENTVYDCEDEEGED